MTGLSGFRDNETEDARANMHCAVNPLPTFVKLVTIGSLATHQIFAQSVNRILRYGDGLCTCARAEMLRPPMTYGKHVVNDPRPTYQI